MSQKTIRIACLGTPSDYCTSLVPLIIQSLGYKIEWVSPIRADLVIYGSFYDVNAPRLRWLPRSWRQRAGAIVNLVTNELAKRRIPPLTLFHTAENLRHNHIKADFKISHDLNVPAESHFRLPYWMEVVDWSHEGVVGNANPRYGELLKLERLQIPLGDQFLKREQKAILVTSHMREPRLSCYENLKKILPVDGMGPYFDQSIKDHHSSKFFKKEILQNYALNLCPENGIHPGYVTEKIPEAFAAGCLPITFVDPSVSADFNSNAFINLATIPENNFQVLEELLNSEVRLRSHAAEPLILNLPSAMPFQKWVQNVVSAAS
jgi:hypothetical protein